MLYILFTFLFTLFLEFCFREGHIFEGWLEFWAVRWYKKEAPEILDSYLDMSLKEVEEMGYETRRELILDNVDWFWFKPLGHCPPCLNIWISILTAPVALYYSQPVGLLEVIIIFTLALFSNFLTRFFLDRIT